MRLRLGRRPEPLHHLGQVEAGAVVFHHQGLPEAVIRRRVLDLWAPGCRLRRSDDITLLLLPTPLSLPARSAPGTLLAWQDGRLCALPLGREVLDRVPLGSLAFLEGATLRVLDPQQLPSVDPAEWIELDDHTWAAVAPLGPPPPPLRVVAPPPQTDARLLFGMGEQGRQGVDGLGEALAGARLSGMGGVGAAGLGGAVVAAGALAALWTRLRGLLGGGPAGGGGGGDGAHGGRAMELPATRRSWSQTLADWAASVGLDRALQRALGPQHASFLRRMLDLFDEDDLSEALHHAIPLRKTPAELSLGGGIAWLSRRGALGFGARGRATGRGSLVASTDLYSHLTALYRRAFERLAAQERYREAAYVRCELLGEPMEAVAWLEDQGQYALAAEVALARELDPAMTVRLLFLAKEPERALVLARLQGAWEAALGMMERGGTEGRDVERLRLAWAAQEHAAGHEAKAADIVWPVPAMRPFALGWLRVGAKGGGHSGARCLARWAALEPQALGDLEPVLTELLAAQGPDAASTRLALLESLQEAVRASPERRWLMEQMFVPLTRALLRDALDQPSTAATQAVRTAASASSDGALFADLPKLPLGVPPRPPLSGLGQEFLDYLVVAEDRGLSKVFDALPLSQGRVLLALGELGAAVVDARGRTLRRVSAVCHQLVASASRRKVLLVARRGRVARVVRMDTLSGRLTELGELEVDLFSTTFDGSTWFVAQGDRVKAIDVQPGSLKVLWSTGELLPPRITETDRAPWKAMRQTEAGLFILGSRGEGEHERFVYRLPGLRLTARTLLTLPMGGRVLGISDQGALAADAEGLVEVHQEGTLDSPVVLDPARCGPAAVSLNLIAQPHGHEVLVFDSKAGGSLGLALRSRLIGAQRAGARVVEGPGERLLCTWDELGRVRIFSVSDGSLVQDLRV